MKAISLWQPWASLVAIGAKRFETRGWEPRGFRAGDRFAIHAAKKQDEGSLKLSYAKVFRTPLMAAGFDNPMSLPFGEIVATAVLGRVLPTSEAVYEISTAERRFGDYSDGRFAWELLDVRRLPEPIPCRGAQGLWNVPEELLPRLRAV